jgi:hypothetical protein
MDKRLWVVGVVAVVIILLAVVTPNGPANAAPQEITGSTETPAPQNDGGSTPADDASVSSTPTGTDGAALGVSTPTSTTSDGFEGASPTSEKPDTPTVTATPEPDTPTPRVTPVPELDINRTRLENLVEAEINEYRRDSGLLELMVEGTTAGEVREMARDHAADLREEGEVWQLTAERDIAAIYEEHDLYRRCRFKKHDANYIVTAEDGQLMAVQSIDASSEDEELIARNVMDNWEDSRFHSDKFDYQNADTVGAGVALDHEADEAYVVMSVC